MFLPAAPPVDELIDASVGAVQHGDAIPAALHIQDQVLSHYGAGQSGQCHIVHSFHYCPKADVPASSCRIRPATAADNLPANSTAKEFVDSFFVEAFPTGFFFAGIDGQEQAVVGDGRSIVARRIANH